MTTFTDISRENFNGDLFPVGGSLGDVLWFDDFGRNELWLMDGGGNAAGQIPLPFTGPTWHIEAAADFNSPVGPLAPLVPRPFSDILLQNDDGSRKPRSQSIRPSSFWNRMPACAKPLPLYGPIFLRRLQVWAPTQTF